MRDLLKYQDDYLKQPYESVHKRFRSGWAIENLMKYGLLEADILEVGCGSESVLRLLSKFRSFDIVEPASRFCESAVKMKDRHTFGDRVSIYNEYVEEFSSKHTAKKYDVIIVSALLHEVQNCEEILSAIRIVAKNGAVVHFDVPNANSFHRILAREMGLIDNVYHKSESNVLFQQNSVFDTDSLKTLLEANSFSVMELGTFVFKPFTHKQMQDLMDTGFFNEKVLNAIVSMDKYIPGLGSEIFAVCRV